MGLEEFKEKMEIHIQKRKKIFDHFLNNFDLMEFKKQLLLEFHNLKRDFFEFKNAFSNKKDPSIQEVLCILEGWEKDMEVDIMQHLRDLFSKEYEELGEVYLSSEEVKTNEEGLSMDDFINLRILINTSLSVEDFLNRI